MNQQSFPTKPQGLARFIVCGLGSLGQHCVVALKEFGVSVIGIEQEIPKRWEINQKYVLLPDSRKASNGLLIVF